MVALRNRIVMVMCMLHWHLLASLAVAFIPQQWNPFANNKNSNNNQLDRTEDFLRLESLIQQSQYGVVPDFSDEIHNLMTSISNDQRNAMDDQRRQLLGQWELIYTTEKEINFFRTSWPFDQVRNITQTIDVFEGGNLNNAINFAGGASFIVDGSVAPVDSEPAGDDVGSGYDRVKFEFETSAVTNLWGRTVALPPVGAGWFDTMYCDGNYRFSKDSRGSWSVFKKA
uniref:Plastid lipid-associated protein/fibrillin conserved domain-containing protein n=1 Tax=Craspedostauros australis TaxID=1486917 RepID=A0A7R9ZKY6_9STRA